jgi:lysyl-tRNA synthetase class 1
LHWADVVAEKLLQRGSSHIIASGTSISGQPHIGSAADVIFADILARAVIDKGGEAEVLWIKDDMDPLRSVPRQLPMEFEEHLGKPVCDLPDIEGEPYVEHFVRPFLEGLNRVGVHPRQIAGSEIYLGGMANDLVRTALDRAEEARSILEDISGSKRPDDWLPFQVVCENCGRIATTKAYARDDEGRVLYRCQGGVAGKRPIEGCGHEGAAPLDHGKLTWRLDWASRWKLLGITSEPFGKDHAAAGGSWDTSSVLIERIFDYPKPVPLVYEHFMVKGGRMSKSKGNVVTLEEMLEVVPPEIVRFVLVRTDPNKHKDFDWAKIPQLVDEFERLERMYYGEEETPPREDPEDLRRIYELSLVSMPPPQVLHQVPYGHLLTLVQLYPDFPDLVATMKRTGELPADVTDDHLERVRSKADNARAWVRDYAPENMVFSLMEELPQEARETLSPEQSDYLGRLASRLVDTEWEGQAIHDTVHGLSKEMDLKARDAFGAVYIAMLDRTRGPRVGYFLASMDRDWVVSRFQEASSWRDSHRKE